MKTAASVPFQLEVGWFGWPAVLWSGSWWIALLSLCWVSFINEAILTSPQATGLVYLGWGVLLLTALAYQQLQGVRYDLRWSGTAWEMKKIFVRSRGERAFNRVSESQGQLQILLDSQFLLMLRWRSTQPHLGGPAPVFPVIRGAYCSAQQFRALRWALLTQSPSPFETSWLLPHLPKTRDGGSPS